MATRLHTFTFVIDLPDDFPDHQAIAVAESAREFSRSHKGGLPLGFQTGVAALPILIRRWWPQSLMHWASQPQPARFAAQLFPVLVDPARAATAYRWKPQRMGRFYERFLRDQAEAAVGPAADR